MIVDQDMSWLRMLFTVRGTSLARTVPRISVITLFSILLTIASQAFDVAIYSLTVTPFALVGVAVSIFLGFRNNAAYDRYWEGRKLWGSLVNVSRSFARQTTNLIESDEGGDAAKGERQPGDLHRSLVYRAVGFVHALRYHLRNTDPRADLQEFLPQDELTRIESQKNIPLFILRMMGERIRGAWQEDRLDTFHLSILEASLTHMTDIQGACERIKNTPFPFAYTALIHRTVAIYCLMLPLGLLETVGVLTPVVVMLISYAFFGLDEIGDEIENPFGTEPQHLPLKALCRTIEVNLLQHLDETPPRELMRPVDGVLR